jgi:2-polyprenyl-6-methoxyphenol hydroxylase-like FAD-dependent oxidoreductase
MAIDFLIVGGGIGGAVLANLLGRRGKRVLVVEQSRASAPQARPEVLWPATVRVLRSLLPERLEPRWMLAIRGAVVMYKRRPLLQFGPELFDMAGVQPYSTDNTRELLMQQAPCEYQRGVKVKRVLRDNGRVVGVRARDLSNGTERDILAEWTVGDDGAHSIIRRDCGLPMTIARLPLDPLGLRFDWPAGLPAKTAHIWLNEDRASTGVLGMAVAPVPEGKGVALLPVWPEVFHDESRLRAALRSFFGRNPILGEIVGPRMYPQGMTRFRLGWGRKPCFGTSGAFLMGDAAHPVTPAGGQGANLAVADALVLAEAALERPSELLDEYIRRRRAAAERSLSLSRGATRIFSLPRLVLNLGLTAAPWAIRWLNNRPELFARLLRFAAGAFQEQS